MGDIGSPDVRSMSLTDIGKLLTQEKKLPKSPGRINKEGQEVHVLVPYVSNEPKRGRPPNDQPRAVTHPSSGDELSFQHRPKPPDAILFGSSGRK